MLLVWMIVAPLLAAAAMALVPADRGPVHRVLALAGSLASLVLGLVLWEHFPAGYQGFMHGELYEFSRAWFPDPLGAELSLGTDGISLVLADMSALLGVLVVLFSWVHVRDREKAYYIFLMIMTTAMLGVFFARDLLLFYLFWETMLIPMYFLVGIWGGKRRLYASIKFVLFTLAGSLLMLVSIVVIYALHLEQFGEASLALVDLYRVRIPDAYGLYLFVGFLLAFAIKTPLFPLHTWLPDAHVEAPSGGSVILAGILLKVGIYGFLRLLIPIFPELSLAWGGLIALLGVVGILYGGLVAWVQEDMKKLIAYSSVSHLGFVVLGLFVLNASSVTGGILQGAVHGVNTGALFLLVGMIYNRVHTREMDEIGGLADAMPWFSTLLVIVSLASIGLPATNGFVGEFTILASSFGRFPLLTVLAALGVVVSALYMLRLLRSCVFGSATEAVDGVSDLSVLEILTLSPLIAIVFWVGLYPAPVIDRIEPSVEVLLRRADVVDARPAGVRAARSSEVELP